MALATFLQLLRPLTLHDQRAQRAYRGELDQMASRLQGVFDAWLALREVAADNVQLANAAAVNRWELMRLARRAEHLEPPRSLANLHRDAHNALMGAARACQLLANGYRFHKSDAVCDGQALLIETVADLNELAGQLQARS
ncbi:MAG TPA: hypothetical protein VF937_10690 [Chloroflexota bacterium]